MSGRKIDYIWSPLLAFLLVENTVNSWCHFKKTFSLMPKLFQNIWKNQLVGQMWNVVSWLKLGFQKLLLKSCATLEMSVWLYVCSKFLIQSIFFIQNIQCILRWDDSIWSAYEQCEQILTVSAVALGKSNRSATELLIRRWPEGAAESMVKN